MNDTLLSTLFIGIDVSLASNHITAMDFHENVYLRKNFTNNIPGSDTFVQAVLDCLHKFPFTHIVIGIESTSIYSTHIASFLASDVTLKAFNVKVYVLNPKTTSKYRETFVNLQKQTLPIVFLLQTTLALVRLKQNLGKVIKTLH